MYRARVVMNIIRMILLGKIFRILMLNPDVEDHNYAQLYDNVVRGHEMSVDRPHDPTCRSMCAGMNVASPKVQPTRKGM